MPFVINTPDVLPVKVESVVSKTIDHYYINSINISLVPGDATKTAFAISWSRGYMDPDFIAIESTISVLDGIDLLTKMNEQVTTGLSHYDDFKIAIWALLQSKGIVPAGVIS